MNISQTHLPHYTHVAITSTLAGKIVIFDPNGLPFIDNCERCLSGVDATLVQSAPAVTCDGLSPAGGAGAIGATVKMQRIAAAIVSFFAPSL